MNQIKKVTVHGGHNPAGRIACGAVGLIDESREDRIITRKVVQFFQEKDIDVTDCTVDDGISQRDVLRRICKKCNAVRADIDISIHFNSGRRDKNGDGITGGVEVLVTKNEGDKGDIAKRICNQMSKLGFRNRGVKETKGLYFLNHTNAPALLIEVCFVDDKDDVKLYKKNKDAVAKAIVKAVLNHNKKC